MEKTYEKHMKNHENQGKIVEKTLKSLKTLAFISLRRPN